MMKMPFSGIRIYLIIILISGYFFTDENPEVDDYHYQDQQHYQDQVKFLLYFIPISFKSHKICET